MRKKVLITGCAIALAVFGLLATVPLLEASAASTTHLLTTPGLGVYSDSGCTQALAVLDWGGVSPGDTVYQTIYVKNLGSNQQRLSLSTANWNPTVANGPIVLNWNMQNAKITAGQVVAANLTLTVSSSATGFTTFTADVTIKGTSYAR